jgi:hypothetical protein
MGGLRLGCIAVSGFVAMGCMSFNNERISVREPEKAALGAKVSCAAKAFGRTFNGKNPPVGALLDDQAGANLTVNQICRIWKLDGLIAEWDTPGEMVSPDYELVLDGTFNESGSMFASVLTGFTLFLIPSSSTMELDLRAALTHKATGRQFEAASVNSTTTWLHLIFLPFFPFSGLGTLHAQQDLAHDLYLKFQAAGAFGR